MESQSTFPEPSLAVFPDSYAHARDLWKQYLFNLRMPTVQRDFSARENAPDGTQLATDTAWIGSRTATHVLVIIGGSACMH
jgi:hypothetical protein